MQRRAVLFSAARNTLKHRLSVFRDAETYADPRSEDIV